jgi:hypothetical protein
MPPIPVASPAVSGLVGLYQFNVQAGAERGLTRFSAASISWAAARCESNVVERDASQHTEE